MTTWPDYALAIVHMYTYMSCLGIKGIYKLQDVHSRIAGKFGGKLNLVVWRFTPTAAIKVSQYFIHVYICMAIRCQI